ncbi:MAG TPA: hypothetical protein VGT44_02100, partial [Ktedonobacteraceae bacterium]|nr:hypothetical protein [Ktedonobacteraceae bacterium]
MKHHDRPGILLSSSAVADNAHELSVQQDSKPDKNSAIRCIALPTDVSNYLNFAETSRGTTSAESPQTRSSTLTRAPGAGYKPLGYEPRLAAPVT